MSRYSRNYQYYQPCKVILSWSASIGAYNLHFDPKNKNHWDKVKAIIAWIKMTIPVGERDYDDITYTWTLDERHFPMLKSVLETMGGDTFDIHIIEKPVGGSSVKFIATTTYFEIFKQHAGEDISTYSEADFSKAKRLYFKTAMRLHPDKTGDDGSAMRDFNEAWDVIKERHFKIQRVMEQTI